MDKAIVTLDKGTTCSAWNYCGQRLATGSNDGTLAIFDSNDPASSSFKSSSKTKVNDVSILKVVWVPPEYGDAVACICSDGTLLLWEEVADDIEHLQWKLCKSFDKKSNQVLDVQFGVSLKSLKMIVFCLFAKTIDTKPPPPPPPPPIIRTYSRRKPRDSATLDQVNLLQLIGKNYVEWEGVNDVGKHVEEISP